MKKSIKRFVGSFLTALILGITTVHAEGPTVEVTNNINVGNVAISLREFTHDASGKEIPLGNVFQNVLPNQKIEKIARITNDGNECWVRASMKFSSKDGLELMDERYVTLNTENWIHKGNYYYYTKSLKTGEAVDFMKGITVPNTTSVDQLKNFDVYIQADAVQTANFTPDFNADDPWFGTVIEVSAYEVPGKMDTGDQHFSVVFVGGIEGLIHNGADFFSNFPSLMPGDAYSDTLVLGNNYNRPVKLYFQIDNIEKDNPLAKAAHVEIRAGETTVFSGTLADAMDERNIATVEPGGGFVMTFTVSIPAELDNRFDLTDTNVKWIFRADATRRSGIPNTGDPSMWKFVGLFVCSITVVGICIYALRRNREEINE